MNSTEDGAIRSSMKNVTHRITWMPRLCIPMKDVASCDKLR